MRIRAVVFMGGEGTPPAPLFTATVKFYKSGLHGPGMKIV